MEAIEVAHYMKSKKRGKIGDVAHKLDISKIYDKIDWEHLKDVLVTMEFCQKWIKWIIICMEIMDYYMVVNGSIIGPITLGRGLRQGDPLSPYLFFLCSEGLQALIKQAEAKRIFMAFKYVIMLRYYLISFFANDCSLFFRASTNEANTLKNNVAIYE